MEVFCDIETLPDLCGGHIFDTHAHYDDPAFYEDTDELLAVLNKYGVSGIITCGCNKDSSIKAVSLAHKYDFVYAAVGLHPENTAEGYDESWIRALAKDGRCVAIGEIGLDYHRSEPNENDKQIFIRQLQLAKELGLPVIMHDREAHQDTFDIVREHLPKGVMHCFSGSAQMARQLVDMGLYIGIGGVLTFKNARKTVEVVHQIPLDMILLETDAPYLAPVPHRGKRNDSLKIAFVAQRLAEIKGVTVRDVLDITEQNAKRLFGIK